MSRIEDVWTYRRVLPVATTDVPPDRRAARSFEDGLRDCWAPTVRYLRAIASLHADVDDLAARAVEVAWRKRGELRSNNEMLPWLLTIARHVARNSARSERRRVRLRVRIAGAREREHQSDAHDELVRGEPGPATKALAGLSRSDREVLVLHAWEELGAADIAKVLGVSRPAASQRLKRARERLQEAIEKGDES